MPGDSLFPIQHVGSFYKYFKKNIINIIDSAAGTCYSWTHVTYMPTMQIGIIVESLMKERRADHEETSFDVCHVHVHVRHDVPYGLMSFFAQLTFQI